MESSHCNSDEDVDDDIILSCACALPLPSCSDDEFYTCEGEEDDGPPSCDKYALLDETTQICAGCDVVLESPSYGPLCIDCHGFLYPDYTVLQQELDEERARILEQHPSASIKASATGANGQNTKVDYPRFRRNSIERILQPRHPNISVASYDNVFVHKEKRDVDSDHGTRGELLGFAMMSLFDKDFAHQSLTEQESAIDDDLVEQMPTEILVKIFSYLDEVGLCKATQVCRRWMVLTNHMENWSTWFEKRWPIFRPVGAVSCWRTLYVRMIQSSTCVPCFEQGYLKRISVDDIPNSWRNKRLRSELKQLLVDPPQGIRACPVDDEYSHWQASIEGPPASVYEGGVFYVHLELPRCYPMGPPIARFLTRILHPNVNRHGNVGMDCLRHNWSLALTIPKILVSIQSILTDPYCDVNMEPIVAQMYREDRELFDMIASDWTRKFAMNHFQGDLSPWEND